MLKAHSIKLWDGDMERLKAIYFTKSANSVIRDLVRAHIERVEAQRSRAKEISNPATELVEELDA